MLPHTVTVYLTEEDPVTFEQTNHITVLRGVLLDASKASNVSKSGLEGADAVNLYIPYTVRATDGVSLLDKSYAGPRAYERANDKSTLWTLDTVNNCFFVRGEVVEPDRDFQYINANYDDVYRVTKVDVKDFGNLRHIQVGGA